MDPGDIDFGTLRPLAVAQVEVRLRASGRNPVRVTSLRIEQNERRMPFSTTAPARTFAAGEELAVMAEYDAPSTDGLDEGVLVLVTDTTQGEVRVALKGRVLAACSPRTECLELEGTVAECGTQADGCGGTVSCGSCGANATCINQVCVTTAAEVDAGATVPDAGNPPPPPPVDAGSCVPTGSCTAAGATCGAVPDGCGGMLPCGACGVGASCTQNQCVCAGGTIELCGDGVDNTCDGNVDCADPQCAASSACAQPACTITDAEYQATQASVAAYSNFVVATGSDWALFTHDDSGNGNLRYTFQKLDAVGQPVGSGTVVSGTGAAHKPFAAYTGTDFGLAWSDASSATQGNDVFFIRVAGTGQRLTANNVPVSVQPGLAFPTSVAWNPVAQEFGVLWGDGRDAVEAFDRALYFRRVDAQGNLVGSEQRLTTQASGVTTDYSDLTWGGTNYGVVATQVRTGGPFMLFNRVSATGTLELPDVQLNATGQGAFMPRIAASPTHYGAVFQEFHATGNQTEIIFTRLSKTGAANATRVQLTMSGTATNPAIAWTGSGWTVIFEDGRSGVHRIYAVRLAADGTRLGGDQLLSCASVAAGLPHLAFNGTRLAATWTSMVAGKPQGFVKTFAP